MKSEKNGSDVRIDDSQVFAEREVFTDCAGRQRSFDLTIHDIPGAGYSGHASEVSPDNDVGYRFRSFTEASLTLCLGRLRGKIRAGLAQRFLVANGDQLDMTQERLCGSIDSDGIVVDGQLLDWASLSSLLQTYEGWDIELRIPFEDR